MAMTLAQVGNGSGFVYVTEADGTTIIANLNNDEFVWQKIQKFANTSAPLTDPTVEFDATFGYRFFGDTGGSAGSIGTASELTRFLVNRGSQVARYKESATISGGVLEITRVTNDMSVLTDTEGGAGTDDLDTITSSGVVDGDIIVLVGADPTHIVTVKHGTGNIFLANSADFVSGPRQSQIILQYYSAATAGWYEVTRENTLPTVANLRANNVAEPIQGCNSTAMGTSGTTTYLPGTDQGYQIITGSPILVGNVVFDVGGSPLDGDEFTVDYRATPTLGGSTVAIFGIVLTATQSAQKCVVRTKYRSADTTWYTVMYVNGDAIDFATTTQLATKENSLGNPAANGYVLSSTTGGTRSWVPNQNNVVLHNDISNNATTAVITQEVLKTYTLPGGTMDLDGDILVIRAVYQTAANANNKTVSIYFGATKVADSTAVAMNDDTVVVEAVINRLEVAAQAAASTLMIADTTTVATVSYAAAYSTPGETLSADVDIECRATNGVAAANDIICRQFSVSIFKKRN